MRGVGLSDHESHRRVAASTAPSPTLRRIPPTARLSVTNGSKMDFGSEPQVEFGDLGALAVSEQRCLDVDHGESGNRYSCPVDDRVNDDADTVAYGFGNEGIELVIRA